MNIDIKKQTETLCKENHFANTLPFLKKQPWISWYDLQMFALIKEMEKAMKMNMLITLEPKPTLIILLMGREFGFIQCFFLLLRRSEIPNKLLPQHEKA